MKLALAQIDMRLGDIEGTCARIADQAELAARAGANLLCTPVPLFGGMQPTTLVDYPNYENDLVGGLVDVAQRVEHLGVDCLVPAVVAIEQTPFVEAFLLREGRVLPLRTMFSLRTGRFDVGVWEPAVFDVAGSRVAAVFDLERDMPQLPRGCDVAIYFQLSGFNAYNEETCAVAGVADGHFTEVASQNGVWLACMAPVGAFDETVYTGGSFVMDDSGRVVACSPCFEEDLLIQEVSRGVIVPALDAHELPRFFREEWIWEALRLHVRDTVQASGRARAALALEGDLPSSLLAVLAVDALGPRNVVGVAFERSDVFTPQQEAQERERMECVRQLAANLNIRLVERSQGDISRWMDRDVPARDAGRLRIGIDALYLADVAHEMDACMLSSLTKTDAALAPAAALSSGASLAVDAPFGDVYLTSLEFLARYRMRVSSVLPPSVVTLEAVAERMGLILAHAIMSCREDPVYTERMAQLLATLEPTQIDGALEAHVDRNRVLEDLPLYKTSPEGAAILLMLTRRAEMARRALPMIPAVSPRSFGERIWPAMLGWSDLGRHGEEPRTVVDVAREGVKHVESLGEAHSERVRGEILGLLGNLLGLSPEQQEELMSEEGQQRMRENMERFESSLRSMLNSASDGQVPDADAQQAFGSHIRQYPFFSQN